MKIVKKNCQVEFSVRSSYHILFEFTVILIKYNGYSKSERTSGNMHSYTLHIIYLCETILHLYVDPSLFAEAG